MSTDNTLFPRHISCSFTTVWPCTVTDFLWIRPTDALRSNFIVITTLHVSGQPFCPSSGVLSCTSFLVHFIQLWWPYATRSSKRSSNMHKMYQSRCTAKNSWWWAERLPETCRVVIPIILDFSASVGPIHKESFVVFAFESCSNFEHSKGSEGPELRSDASTKA